jgi:O-antigen ligase
VQGPLGLPAQSIKSAIAPEQLSAADMSSNFYRQVETYNLVETIRQNPVLGRGFGQKFLQVYPLPYIPFVWAEYIPHNSVLWIWMNTGAGGFIAMLYLFGAGISVGARATMRMRSRHGAALALTATLYLVMYPIYAYVDIAWDTASMVYLGAALAIVGNIARFDDAPTDHPDPRDRVDVPKTDSNAPFGTITVVFGAEQRERWAS